MLFSTKSKLINVLNDGSAMMGARSRTIEESVKTRFCGLPGGSATFGETQNAASEFVDIERDWERNPNQP